MQKACAAAAAPLSPSSGQALSKAVRSTVLLTHLQLLIKIYKNTKVYNCFKPMDMRHSQAEQVSGATLPTAPRVQY